MIKIFDSSDGRLRTDLYKFGTQDEFVVAERTTSGVLLSKFNRHGEVLDQVYKNTNDPLLEIRNYMKEIDKELEIFSIDAYSKVEVNATCENCGKKSISRELDLLEAGRISDVPVVPMFKCTNCSKKFYFMGEEYLKNLVSRNISLFEPEEIKLGGKDEVAFLKEIHEYMIRIFASKRLLRLKINK